LARKLDIYNKLLQKLKDGTNICIFEIDVPEKSKKGHFNEVEDDNTYNCTSDKINLLLNDPSEAFGHGLCLTKALLEDLQK
jgi:hypothetical protein